MVIGSFDWDNLEFSLFKILLSSLCTKSIGVVMDTSFSVKSVIVTKDICSVSYLTELSDEKCMEKDSEKQDKSDKEREEKGMEV